MVALNPRIEKGFDFLGYHFGSDGLGVARATIENFIKRASRPYEQKRIGKAAPDAFGMYIRRWMRWVRSGVGEAGRGWKRRPEDRRIMPNRRILSHYPSPPPHEEAKPGEAEGKDGKGSGFGYHFSREGLRVAKATFRKFVVRATRLYEQEEERNGSSVLGLYVRRWVCWASSGLGPAGGSGSVLSFVYSGFYAVLS